jgi:uncharacterized protein DUF6946/HD domain-containing protein
MLSNRFELALLYANLLHVEQTRKDTEVPYIAHLLGVASTVLEWGGTEDHAIAALLHDALEDHPDKTSVEEITQRFGYEVAGIVRGCTDSTTIPKPPWRERKEAYVARIAKEPAPTQFVSAADKLYNARAIVKDYRVVGERLWERFTGKKEGTLWYYRALVRAFTARVNPHLVRELDQVVSQMERIARPARSPGRFFHAYPLTHPEDVRRYLADPLRHWRPGYSACELATSWIDAGDIPPVVRAVLDGCELYREAALVEGFFERKVSLGTPGRESQPDLVLLLNTAQGYAVAAVEGKASEPFGAVVSDWASGSPTRRARLANLCGMLGLVEHSTWTLRYQLLHRAVSALHEARRYHSRHALFLVHAFGAPSHSFGDFAKFASALGVSVEQDRVSSGVTRGDVELRLAWVNDRGRRQD